MDEKKLNQENLNKEENLDNLENLENLENQDSSNLIVNNAQEDNSENLDNSENSENLNKEEHLTPTPMESLFEVDTDYDYRAQKYCQMYRLRVKNKTIIINIVFSLILLALSVYMFLYNEGNARLIAILPFIFFLYSVYGIIFEEKKVDNYLRKFFASHAKFTLHYKINKDMIRFTQIVNGEERWADFPWAYVNEVHKIPEYYFLFLNGGNILIIDRRNECMKKGTQTELDEFLREICEFKPFVVNNKNFVKTLVDVTYYNDPKFDEEVKVEDIKVESQDNQDDYDDK